MRGAAVIARMRRSAVVEIKISFQQHKKQQQPNNQNQNRTPHNKKTTKRKYQEIFLETQGGTVWARGLQQRGASPNIEGFDPLANPPLNA